MRRAARFAREAAAPVPPPPAKKFAHPDGLVVHKEATQVFLQKRLEAGLPLTEAQRRALKLIQPGQENAQQSNTHPPGAGIKQQQRKKKRGPPPKSFLVTPSPEAPIARHADSDASPCFHHLSNEMQRELGLAGVTPLEGQDDLRKKIAQKRSSQSSSESDVEAHHTPVPTRPSGTRPPPAETPDWLRQASKFLLHHSPLYSTPVPPLETPQPLPPQVAMQEYAPVAPPPPTSPLVSMGTPNTRRNRLFRSVNRLPIPTYSPTVAAIVSSPLKAARIALGRELPEDPPPARRLNIDEEDLDKPTTRKSFFNIARLFLLVILVLTSSSAWFVVTPQTTPSVVAALAKPPPKTTKIGLLAIFDEMRRPRLNTPEGTCSVPVCRWKWSSLSCGAKDNCGWRFAWPLGSHWCYEKEQ